MRKFYNKGLIYESLKYKSKSVQTVIRTTPHK